MEYMKKVWVFIFAMTMTLSCISCTDKANPSPKTKGLNIVTSFYPEKLLVSNLMLGTDNNIAMLFDENIACLHDVSLSANDMVAINKSDLFITNGSLPDSATEKIKKSTPDLKIINVSSNIDFLPLHKEEEEDHSEDDEVDHDNEIEHEAHDNNQDKIEHETHEHDSDEKNSHAWLSIMLYIKQLDVLYYEVAKLDSANKDIYDKNYLSYKERLNKLYTKMSEELASYKGKRIVVFHESFDYFAKEFGLDVVDIITSEARENIGAKKIKELIDLLNNNPDIVLFAENGFSTNLVETLAKETNRPYYLLNNIENSSNINDYETTMLKNLEVLKEAFK